MLVPREEQGCAGCPAIARGRVDRHPGFRIHAGRRSVAGADAFAEVPQEEPLCSFRRMRVVVLIKPAGAYVEGM